MELGIVRAEFARAVVDSVAGRAGYRCSFPGCGKPTIGPGAGPYETCSIGVAAHIYAASPVGPRGQGSLTQAELAGHGNAIWLCQTHARMVDANRGDKYAPSVLLGYRDRHEFGVSREMGDLPGISGWIEEVVVGGGPLGAVSAIRLGKATVFQGANDTGKTMVCDWIAGTLSTRTLQSWKDASPAPTLSLRLLNRDGANLLTVHAENGSILYSLDGAPVPYNPLDYRVVYLRDVRTGRDSAAFTRIADTLAIDLDTAAGLSPFISSSPDSYVRSASVESGGLWLETLTTSGPLRFESLSDGEQSLVVIEYALALAATEASFRPTLLCIDAGIGVLDRRATENLVARLSSAAFTFQTIVVTAEESAHFFGWQAYDFKRGGPRMIAPAYQPED